MVKRKTTTENEPAGQQGRREAERYWILWQLLDFKKYEEGRKKERDRDAGASKRYYTQEIKGEDTEGWVLRNELYNDPEFPYKGHLDYLRRNTGWLFDIQVLGHNVLEERHMHSSHGALNALEHWGFKSGELKNIKKFKTSGFRIKQDTKTWQTLWAYFSREKPEDFIEYMVSSYSQIMLSKKNTTDVYEEFVHLFNNKLGVGDGIQLARKFPGLFLLFLVDEGDARTALDMATGFSSQKIFSIDQPFKPVTYKSKFEFIAAAAQFAELLRGYVDEGLKKHRNHKLLKANILDGYRTPRTDAAARI